MATSKYFVLTPAANNLDFLDFDLQYGNGSITTVGQSIQYNGSALVDSIFVRPGLTYDLSSTAGGVDKIYLTGNLSDYSLSVNTTNFTLTLTRTVGGLNETLTVAGGSSNNFDRLVFANGTVTNNALYIASASGAALPVPSTTETSLAPIGAAAPGATLEATIKAFSSNPAATNQVGETFASVRPGINLIVNGGNGIDTVYVADGSTVDATVLGKSVDLVYFRGKWADYTKSTQSNGTDLVFTRQINGATEAVKVAAGTSLNFDRLIFADGSVASNNAKAAILGNPTGAIETVTGYNPNQTTPLYSDPEIATALATIRDAAQANSATATTPAQLVYQVAGVTGVTADNLASVNSALNSTAITGALADTTPEVQAIVNAYNAILTSADGTGGNTATPLTGNQYAAIGVTGVSGSASPETGSALHLLDDAVDRSPRIAVDTQPELQLLFGAAQAVQAQAAGTAGLTMAQLGLLGVTDQNGVLLGNSVDATTRQAILAKINAALDDGSSTDTVAELQALVNGVNHAPVLATTNVANSNALYPTNLASSYGTVIETPAIEGPPGTNPAGWAITYSGWGGTTWLNNANNDSPMGNPNYSALAYLEGTSLNGGSFVQSKEGGFNMHTYFYNLIAGQTYTLAYQWQQISQTPLDATYGPWASGGITWADIILYDSNYQGISQPFHKSYTSPGLVDGWQTAIVTFTVAPGTARTLLRIGAENPNRNGAGIVVDSLNVAQTQAEISRLTNAPGVTANSLFGTVTDVDPGATLKGWAITRAAADTSGHHWQYSTDNGSSWVNMDAASASQAVYLSTTDLVRWTGLKGTNTELNAKAVDDTGPALHAANAAATLVDASLSGFSSAFSGNTAVLAAQAAPLLFDLNHDGKINYSHITMPMDGQQVDTAWVGPADAILLWDKHGDGVLHGSDQYVFGQTTGSDLSGLQQTFDSNQDFVFDSKDALFNQFGLWQDANQNGRVDTGEFHSLAQHGISALALQGDGRGSTPSSGVTVTSHAMATLADGRSMLVADATFSYVQSAVDNSLHPVPYFQPMVHPTQVI